MSNNNIIFDHFATFLKSFWKENRTLDELYSILATLHTKGCKPPTVKDNFIRHESIPEELYGGVFLLLLETDFYNQYFDIGMITRIEMMNSDRIAFQIYKYLKNIHKNFESDELYFWRRWIDLYEVRYDSDRFSDEHKKKIFDKLEKYTNYTFFTVELEKIKNLPKYESLYNALKDRLSSINYFFTMTFYQFKRGWFKHFHYKVDNYKDNEMQKDENCIRKCIDQIQNNINNLKKTKSYQDFHYDYRINYLYYYGSKLIGYDLKDFKEQPQNRRQTILEECEKLLSNEMKIEATDNLQYRIWYDYYYFIHIQRCMQHKLLEEKCDYYEALELILKCLNLLDNLENSIKGGFLRILLKVYYHKRNLEYIKFSIKAFLLERSIEEPFNMQPIKQVFRPKIENDKSKQDLEWIMKIREKIFIE